MAGGVSPVAAAAVRDAVLDMVRDPAAMAEYRRWKREHGSGGRSRSPSAHSCSGRRSRSRS